MGQNEQKEMVTCPECGQALWYDDEYECWVCDECEIEFYEDDEDWDDEEEEEW
jgi:ribosomal protein L37AE/L43A